MIVTAPCTALASNSIRLTAAVKRSISRQAAVRTICTLVIATDMADSWQTMQKQQYSALHDRQLQQTSSVLHQLYGMHERQHSLCMRKAADVI